MAPSDALAYQSATLSELIAGVRPDQLGHPTPCGEWDVRALINHFVGGAAMFSASLRGEPVAIDPDAPMPDLVGSDPLGAFTAAIGDFNRAVDEPGALEKVVTLPFGQLPVGAVLEYLKFDLTAHCWDLAQATGQSFDPPDAVVAEADAIGHAMVDGMRAGGAFGAEAPAPANATPIERLLAFTGRSVVPTG